MTPLASRAGCNAIYGAQSVNRLAALGADPAEPDIEAYRVTRLDAAFGAADAWVRSFVPDGATADDLLVRYACEHAIYCLKSAQEGGYTEQDLELYKQRHDALKARMNRETYQDGKPAPRSSAMVVSPVVSKSWSAPNNLKGM